MKKLLILAAVLTFGLISVVNAENLVKIGNAAVIGPGTEFENAVVIGGDLTLEGVVHENAVVIGGDLKMGGSARIEDNAVVIFGKIIREGDAVLPKNTVELSFNKLCTSGWCLLPVFGIFAISLFGLAMLVAFAALFMMVAAFFTKRVGRTSYYIEKRPWKAICIGFVVALLVMPVTLFLIVTIIGIPLIPLLFIILSAAALFGFTAACQLVGLKFFRAIKKPGRPMILEVITGLIILGFVMMIPVVGCIVKLLVWLAGMGAVAATKFGTASRA